MNEELIPKTALNMKLKRKRPRERQTSKWEQQVRKGVTRKGARTSEETAEKLWEERDRRRGLLLRRHT